MRRALFVCMGNTCRSPMAAAVARRILGDKVIVESTGISASRGAPAAQHAIEVMAERELNIRDHSARGFDSVDLSAFDLIVAMDAEVAKGLRSRGVDAAKLIELNVDDPFGEDIEYYRRTAESIELRLRRIFQT